VADTSLLTNLTCQFFPLESMLRLSDFYYKSNISFTGTGLGRQFDHGFTSVRPVQPPSSAVGSPVVGYADPSHTSLTPVRTFNLTRATGRRLCRPPSYLTYARSNFKPNSVHRSSAMPTPLVPQYVPAWPPARPSVYRSSLYRPLSHLTYARLTSLT